MSTDTREVLAALPPLPVAHGTVLQSGRYGREWYPGAVNTRFGGTAVYTADQMQAYARAALATQPAQPSVELSVRAVEELLQLGYTVKGDLLYPPVVRLKKEQITKELLDGGTDGAPMRAFLEAEGKSTTPAQPSAQGEAVATLDRESTWWALAMGAAASLEDAATCMRDEDAKRAALGAAAHVRKQCAAIAATKEQQA